MAAVGIVQCKVCGGNIFFVEVVLVEWKKQSKHLDIPQSHFSQHGFVILELSRGKKVHSVNGKEPHRED